MTDIKTTRVFPPTHDLRVSVPSFFVNVLSFVYSMHFAGLCIYVPEGSSMFPRVLTLAANFHYPLNQ